MTEIAWLLRAGWGIEADVVAQLAGGMNSRTWRVEHRGSTYVAKQVAPGGLGDLVAGCEAAARLAEAGLATGRPVPTLEGHLLLVEHRLVLLEHLPGRELEGDTAQEQARMAGALAAVHHVGGARPGPVVAGFMAEWLSPGLLPGTTAHPWVESALRTVREETDPLSLTWSLLHTDPAPEAFLHDSATGSTGLVDWAGARRGPVLYDVASAVMYLGGPQEAGPFLDAYRARGPLDAGELGHLDALRRLRWVVQAAYFLHRLATGDLTGLAGRAGNEKGLQDARRGLEALGVDTGRA